MHIQVYLFRNQQQPRLKIGHHLFLTVSMSGLHVKVDFQLNRNTNLNEVWISRLSINWFQIQVG